MDSESFLISSRGGYAGTGVQGNFAIMERGVGGDELLVQETRGKKLPLDSQAKIEGRRGQNWTNSEVEALIALRGEMHEEFERNKQKQGTFKLNLEVLNPLYLPPHDTRVMFEIAGIQIGWVQDVLIFGTGS